MSASILLWFGFLSVVFAVLAFYRRPLFMWSSAIVLGLTVPTVLLFPPPDLLIALWMVSGIILVFLHILPLRRNLLSRPLLSLFRKIMPPISKTEKEALEAGTTWWDAELFSGKPDWRKIISMPPPSLTKEEQNFLAGPVEELCGMLDEWQITHTEMNLPPAVWDFFKNNGFFGMIIPRRYGGLEFSAQAHSAVIVKLVSKSITAAVTAMVPNSLGPGQLLLRYGTEEQKERYLPGLAVGDEIPCFALTSSVAGSDAASMQDTGIVCKGKFGGEDDVLGIRLNWEKRYITLAPVATLLGLAFKLYDPELLLGDEEDLGITLALIPTDLPGVEVGRRHFPLNQAFLNGPTRGRDVFVPLDYIIGGRQYAGQGWRMLMECLADGRAISLPALAAGLGKLASRATGAYAHFRKQFKVPIARFEGVEEALTGIIGRTYAIDAVRQMTVQALDEGERPSVISAVAKYHCTERMRRVLNDAMDVFGGTAICLGPKNLLGRYYESIPISITVEGANILTRSLIIFGQGLVRCHPYLLAEMEAVQNRNKRQGIKDFDRALFGHMGFVISNVVRTLLLAVFGGRPARNPFKGNVKRYTGQVTRMSAALALASDMALMVLGGALKRKEKLSARLGDVLANLYIVSAAIKRFEDQGRPGDDRVLLDWVCQDSLYRAQEQMDGFLRNFPGRTLAWLMRQLIFPNGKPFLRPDDRLGHRVASRFSAPSESRQRLTSGIFIPDGPDGPLGRIEQAFDKNIAVAEIELKVRKAFKVGKIKARGETDAIDAARAAEVITAKEAEKLREAYESMVAAVAVDDFAPEEFLHF